ncbi:MAG: NADP-dependent oxidoreductase [Phycisphaerales bacterium]
MTLSLRPTLAIACMLVAATAAHAIAAEPTMRAARISAYGGPELLKVEEVPRPTVGLSDVLVRVHAAGVNPVDWKIQQGMLAGFAPKPPATLGQDVSGIVEAVGDKVAGFKVGDEVFAYLSLQRGGAFAEYASIPESELALKPKSLDHMQAAAVPLAALTAWQALIDTAKLQPGQTVLIHAGAGGVGHFAVQIAKAQGAKVIATASETNQSFLKELGADIAIDYKAAKFEDIAKDVDIVLDPIGGDTLERSYQVLKPGGFLVSIVGPPDQAKLQARGATGAGILVKPSGKQLAELAAFIDTGKVKPHVSATFPLADIAKAFEQSQTGRTRGKIVLTVK